MFERYADLVSYDAQPFIAGIGKSSPNFGMQVGGWQSSPNRRIIYQAQYCNTQDEFYLFWVKIGDTNYIEKRPLAYDTHNREQYIVRVALNYVASKGQPGPGKAIERAVLSGHQKGGLGASEWRALYIKKKDHSEIVSGLQRMLKQLTIEAGLKLRPTRTLDEAKKMVSEAVLLRKTKFAPDRVDGTFVAPHAQYPMISIVVSPNIFKRGIEKKVRGNITYTYWVKIEYSCTRNNRADALAVSKYATHTPDFSYNGFISDKTTGGQKGRDNEGRIFQENEGAMRKRRRN
ncbi:hypothetical protein OPQ81_008358 [Rhizoctonia solani]|nr:hypothetical protein OPQ81_008358 [Rhizoctonia solani]